MTEFPEKLGTAVDEWVAEKHPQLVSVRRHLHAHPELAFAEFETTSFLEQRLRSAGLEPKRLPTGTGLVVEVGSGDPTVVLRADIDALPLADLKDVPYASTREGMCHACGHDVHTTVALGAVLALAGLDDLPGTVRCVFQPAEETVPGGATHVLAAGVLDGASRAFALQVDPRAGFSLVWGAVNAGVAANAIPQRGTLRGTVRVLDRDEWKRAEDLLRRLVEQVVAPTGADVEVEYVPGVPPVVNDPRAVALLRTAALQTVGAENVRQSPQSMGGEDFGWFADVLPIALARLGTHGGGPPLDLHRGTFDVDERAIGVGVRLMVRTALQALAADAGSTGP